MSTSLSCRSTRGNLAAGTPLLMSGGCVGRHEGQSDVITVDVRVRRDDVVAAPILHTCKSRLCIQYRPIGRGLDCYV